jgi:hypothetical protein
MHINPIRTLLSHKDRTMIRLAMRPGYVKPRLEMEGRLAIADKIVEAALAPLPVDNPESAQWDNRRER